MVFRLVFPPDGDIVAAGDVVLVVAGGCGALLPGFARRALDATSLPETAIALCVFLDVKYQARSMSASTGRKTLSRVPP